MTKDIVYDFAGLHGYKSKCHLRILHDANNHVVVICSQMRSNNGTSVTNYVEEIYKENVEMIISQFMKPTLFEAIKNYFAKNEIENIIEDILAKLDKRKYKYIPFMLDLLKDTFTISKNYQQSKNAIEDILKNITWIEHYPPGTGIVTHSDTYAIVTLDENNSPTWDYLSLDNISKITSYAIERFQIESSKLD